MIGVDERFAVCGFGGDLLVDALKRIACAADALGIAVVVLDLLGDGDTSLVAHRKTLYERATTSRCYPFRDPLRLFLALAAVRSLIEGPSYGRGRDGWPTRKSRP
jgi:hypothetical protein